MFIFCTVCSSLQNANLCVILQELPWSCNFDYDNNASDHQMFFSFTLLFFYYLYDDCRHCPPVLWLASLCPQPSSYILAASTTHARSADTLGHWVGKLFQQGSTSLWLFQAAELWERVISFLRNEFANIDRYTNIMLTPPFSDVLVTYITLRVVVAFHFNLFSSTGSTACLGKLKNSLA